MNPSEIEVLVETLRPIVVDNHLCKATLLNKTDFIFVLSRERKRKLFLSLENGTPFLTLAEINTPFSSLVTPFQGLLKRELDDGLIQDFYVQKNDRVIVLKIEKVTDAYVTLVRYLIIELIPSHPNLILTDDQWSILGVYKPSTSLEEKRPLLRGLLYRFPEPMAPRDFPLGEMNLQKLFDDHEKKALLGRSKEKYKPLFHLVKARIDSLTKKIEKQGEDIAKAQSKLIDKDKGNAILSSIGSIPENSASLSFEGLEISLNPQWSLSDNANVYFKSYRKSKNTLKKAAEQQALAQAELQYFSFLSGQMMTLDDEDLEGIIAELEEGGYLTPEKTPKRNPKVKAIHPYFFTTDGVKIGFGKNNLQNDYLTFKVAQPSHFFFHVKNDHGAHVVVLDDHPSDEIKTIACEVALLLSGKTDGEVLMAKKSTVKKADRPGLVRLDKYQSFFLKKIRPETLIKMKEAHR